MSSIDYRFSEYSKTFVIVCLSKKEREEGERECVCLGVRGRPRGARLVLLQAQSDQYA